jgi:hypothetical protein
LDITTFEDLKCWQEGKKLFSLLSVSLEGGETSPARRVLVEDLLKEALAIPSEIAGSFSRRGTNSFLIGLRRVLAICRRLANLLILAGDSDLLAEDELRSAKEQLKGVESSVKEHIRFLVNVEIKRRYLELEEL